MARWSMLHVLLFILNLRSHIDLSIYNHGWLMMALSDISRLSSRFTLSCLIVISTSLIISTLSGLSTLLFYDNRISLILRPDSLWQQRSIVIFCLISNYNWFSSISISCLINLSISTSCFLFLFIFFTNHLLEFIFVLLFENAGSFFSFWN